MTLFALDGTEPVLPDGFCWIADTARVIGSVELGEDVGIWYGAVLRGDNERLTVGARTNIQDMTMVHADWGSPATIGEGCTIGHSAIIHGCTIGNNSLIGMGAVVLNGARIGNNCLVGAGALVTEGKEFPDNSLIVGAPAKAVRTLDEKGAGAGRMIAAVYAARAKKFRTGLVKIAD